jgi:murein DD-endopeptidase MepM/ murein hydrolase activator NlpD
VAEYFLRIFGRSAGAAAEESNSRPGDGSPHCSDWSMKLRKSYTFLYMPADHGPSRQFRVGLRQIALPVLAFALLATVAVFYGLGVGSGNSWLPGGSRLQKENSRLRGTICRLEDQVTELRQEIDGVREIQALVAAAVNLPIIDAETFAAGVGGRGDLGFGPQEVPGLAAGSTRVEPRTERDLDLMLRQAKIQRQGYLAMLDTLSARDQVRRKIPSIRPTDIGWMSSRFGFRTDPFTNKQTFHRGLDFSLPSGTPVRVTGDGVVLEVQTQRGFGRVVKIDHGNDVVTVYAHLSEALVKKGQQVSRGDIIAKSGNSGRSSAPHLHYEIRIKDRPVNPLSYILDSYAARD